MAQVIGIRDENNRPIKAGLGLMRRPEWGAEPGKQYFVITWNDA